MIQIVCTHCQQTLEIDDGFAGGVCRCQYCGTIQTVPKQMAAGSRPRAPGSKTPQPVGSDAPKSLYQVRNRSGMSSHPSGLEELAEIVHSSGLAGSGLQNRSPKQPIDYHNAKHHPKPKNNSLLIIGIVVALLVGILGAASLFFMRKSAVVTPVAVRTGPTTPNLATGNAPAFADMPITDGKVIYLLDRGDATSDFFASLQELTKRSVKSLGGDRRFQVALWTCNNSDDTYPRSSLAYANADEVSKLSRWFDEVPTGGQTSLDTILPNVLKLDPDAIILVTGKAWQLDSSFADKVLKARGSSKVVIHTITLGDNSSDNPMKAIASETKGQHLSYSRSALKTLAE